MKKYKLMIILFHFSILVIGQNEYKGSIIFKKKVEVQINKNLTDLSEIEDNERTKQLIEDLEKLNYILKVNNNITEFKLVETLPIDDSGVKIAKLIGGGNGIYFKDILKKINLHKKEAFGNLYLIKISSDSIKWQLTSESKYILNFKCFKAISNRKIETRRGPEIQEIEAWYTPEININSGPIGFGGLPGLILELRRGKFIFYAVKISHDLPIKEIIMPNKGKTITQKEFDQIAKSMFQNRG